MSLVVFNVYEPPNATGDRFDRAARLAFVKDSFHWMAALFPAIWFLVKGLWLELLVFLVSVGAIGWGLEALGATNEFTGMLLIIVQIVIGYEAADIEGAALERRGFRMAGSVTDHTRADCERRFLASWLPAQPHTDAEPGTSAPMPAPASWLMDTWQHAKDSFARGRRLART